MLKKMEAKLIYENKCQIFFYYGIFLSDESIRIGSMLKFFDNVMYFKEFYPKCTSLLEPFDKLKAFLNFPIQTRTNHHARNTRTNLLFIAQPHFPGQFWPKWPNQQSKNIPCARAPAIPIVATIKQGAIDWIGHVELSNRSNHADKTLSGWRWVFQHSRRPNPHGCAAGICYKWVSMGW